jgi:hypothetical protein
MMTPDEKLVRDEWPNTVAAFGPLCDNTLWTSHRCVLSEDARTGSNITNRAGNALERVDVSV